ncbi:alpha-galactosidase [Dysgonomonas termitidis]|uniref:Alpha-galactosidase n=1 Tax=Dysgonomonas termitidis TaxID=1516126 RepID=A0ABV9KXE2_9BACT
MKSSISYLFITILLFLFSNNVLGKGSLNDNEFAYENGLMKQVLSFKNNTILVKSVYEKASQTELIAGNDTPFFEFQINNKTVTSSMPVWKFIKYKERKMVNDGVEYTFYFEGKGTYKGLKLELYRQYFENSTLIREKIQLQSSKGHIFTLNKKKGKLYFVYPQYALNSDTKTDVEEIQIANFLSWNHMFHPAIKKHNVKSNEALLLKGPFSVVHTQNHKIISTYEHASQDGAAGFRLSEITSKKKGDVDESQGVEGDDTELHDENFWFIAHKHTRNKNTHTVATEMQRGGYLDNETIPYDSYYETVWNSLSFIDHKQPTEPLIHDYLFSKITEHLKSRDSHFYYNTWAMQRESQKRGRGHDLRGVLTEERILQEIDAAAEMNIELFVLDDGWEEELGFWTPHSKRLPNGLAPLVDRINEHNMIAGIWLSPMAIDSLTERYKKHPEWIIRRSNGKPIVAQWNRPVFDIVGPFSELFLEDCKALIDNGIRFFKWDAMNTFNSSLAGLDHGDDRYSKKERLDRYNYLFPFYVTRIMRELHEYNKDVVVEIDLTEPERCVIGLMPLQEGIFFFINNGGSAYGDYSIYRTKCMRTVINEYGHLFPKELFTYAVYPNNVSPYWAQQYNVNSSLISGHGFWGDLTQLSKRDRVNIGKTLNKTKRVRPYVKGKQLNYNSKVGASPEIYTQMDSTAAFGQVIGFSAVPVNYSCTLLVNTSQLLGVLNSPYTSDAKNVYLEFNFIQPDDTSKAFLIGNMGENISVISSTGQLDDIQLENNRLMIKTVSTSTVFIKYKDKKLIKVTGGSVLSQNTDEITIRSEAGKGLLIAFENIL